MREGAYVGTCTQTAKWAVFPNFTRKSLKYSLKNTDFSKNVTKLVLIKIEIKTNRDDYFIVQNRKVDVPEWNPFGRLVRVDLENCTYFWKICSYARWQEDEVLLNPLTRRWSPLELDLSFDCLMIHDPTWARIQRTLATSWFNLPTSKNTVEPRLTATSVIRSPRYYGHIFWPYGKNDDTFSCKETLVNSVTSLLRPIVFGPLVTVLAGFHCIVK